MKYIILENNVNLVKMINRDATRLYLDCDIDIEIMNYLTQTLKNYETIKYLYLRSDINADKADIKALLFERCFNEVIVNKIFK